MKDFIKSLQRPDNETLIEAVLEGYAIIFENYTFDPIPPEKLEIKTNNGWKNITDVDL